MVGYGVTWLFGYQMVFFRYQWFIYSRYIYKWLAINWMMNQILYKQEMVLWGFQVVSGGFREVFLLLSFKGTTQHLPTTFNCQHLCLIDSFSAVELSKCGF